MSRMCRIIASALLTAISVMAHADPPQLLQVVREPINAGGDVAWSLWVTKFAPEGRVADYMSVHTFFTGVRGVLAPLLAFHLVSTLGMEMLGWSSVVLIVLASLLLVPEFKFGRRARPAAALTEEVSE